MTQCQQKPWHVFQEKTLIKIYLQMLKSSERRDGTIFFGLTSKMGPWYVKMKLIQSMNCVRSKVVHNHVRCPIQMILLNWTQSKFLHLFEIKGLCLKKGLEIFSVRSYIDLCVDYGFWERSSMRCATSEKNLVYKTHAVFCNRDTINCPHTSWKNCQNSSSQKECDDDHYFCKLSKTCISRGTWNGPD